MKFEFRYYDILFKAETFICMFGIMCPNTFYAHCMCGFVQYYLATLQINGTLSFNLKA